jgi:hypothetical protein
MYLDLGLTISLIFAFFSNTLGFLAYLKVKMNKNFHFLHHLFYFFLFSSYFIWLVAFIYYNLEVSILQLSVILLLGLFPKLKGGSFPHILAGILVFLLLLSIKFFPRNLIFQLTLYRIN